MALAQTSFFSGEFFTRGFFATSPRSGAVGGGAAVYGDEWVTVNGVRKRKSEAWIREELEAVYRAVSGEPAIEAEVHAVVAPFVKRKSARAKEVIPVTAINWTRLRQDAEAINELVALYVAYVERRDDDDAAEILLLM